MTLQTEARDFRFAKLWVCIQSVCIQVSVALRLPCILDDGHHIGPALCHVCQITSRSVAELYRIDDASNRCRSSGWLNLNLMFPYPYRL